MTGLDNTLHAVLAGQAQVAKLMDAPSVAEAFRHPIPGPQNRTLLYVLLYIPDPFFDPEALGHFISCWGMSSFLPNESVRQRKVQWKTELALASRF